MSHQSLVRAVLLLVIVAALGICVAHVTASWNTGSQVGASWVSGIDQAPDQERI
jgi:autotransporter translocation and assembly factor TamB